MFSAIAQQAANAWETARGRPRPGRIEKTNPYYSSKVARLPHTGEVQEAGHTSGQGRRYSDSVGWAGTVVEPTSALPEMLSGDDPTDCETRPERPGKDRGRHPVREQTITGVAIRP